MVRVLGAGQEGQGSSSSNNNHSETESDNEGGGAIQEKSHRGEGVEEGGNTRALTAEVDLDEARWAECTGREKERRLSKSNAKKLAGKYPPLVHAPDEKTLYTALNTRTALEGPARGVMCDAFAMSLLLAARVSFCTLCHS